MRGSVEVKQVPGAQKDLGQASMGNESDDAGDRVMK